MMPLYEIQRAVFATLNGDPLLTGKVFDYVPDGTPFPYVRIGEVVDAPDNALASRGWSSLLTVHVWSKAHGFSEGLALAKRVTELLDLRPLAVTGFHHVATRYTSALTMVDPEPPGDVRHIAVSFTVLTEE
ncbi:DUF3168 domain-containing protein [Streptomyces mirabilis]